MVIQLEVGAGAGQGFDKVGEKSAEQLGTAVDKRQGFRAAFIHHLKHN